MCPQGSVLGIIWFPFLLYASLVPVGLCQTHAALIFPKPKHNSAVVPLLDSVFLCSSPPSIYIPSKLNRFT